MASKPKSAQNDDQISAITVTVQPSGAISTALTAEQIQHSLILQTVEILELEADSVIAERELAEQQAHLALITTAVKAEMAKAAILDKTAKIVNEKAVVAAATDKALSILDRIKAGKGKK